MHNLSPHMSTQPITSRIYQRLFYLLTNQIAHQGFWIFNWLTLPLSNHFLTCHSACMNCDKCGTLYKWFQRSAKGKGNKGQNETKTWTETENDIRCLNSHILCTICVYFKKCMNFKFAFIHNIDLDQQNANMMSDSKIPMPEGMLIYIYIYIYIYI